MSDPIEELLERLLSVDGVYCPDCDEVIKFEETVTTSRDRKLDCHACLGECSHCHCALAQIYCFISRKVPWMLSIRQSVTVGKRPGSRQHSER